MTPAKHRNHLSDLRGASRLAIDATRGVADLVEAMHHNISRVPGILDQPPAGRTRVSRTAPSGAVLADDVQLCDWLVEAGRVAIVPGTGFGAPGFARLSYACSMDDIRKGIGRIAEALATLS